MPRASMHTTRTLTATMRETLQSVERGEPCRHLTEISEHGAESYTRRALIDRGLLTENNQITERGRAVLFNGGVSEDGKNG